MKRETLEIECWFLVPIRRDSGNRELHQPVLWQLLDEAFEELEVGLTGPEIMDWARKKATVPGVWKRIIDESRKYTVFVPPAKLDALRSLLKKGREFI